LGLFDVNFLDDSKAVCKLCQSDISRGSQKERRFTTSALYTHLRTRHGPELTRAERERQEAEATPAVISGPSNRKRASDTSQSTLQAVLAKKQTWAPDHASAVLATKYLAEMIATDLQPNSIVENVGFVRYSRNLEPRYVLPSRRLLSERIIPDMYLKVKESVQKSVSAANKLSFTTDIWTESNTTKPFIGVSVHWIDSHWDRKFAVLNCEEFNGRHSGDMIAEKFGTVLTAWNIPKESCHLVLRDNAANTVRAFLHADIPSLGCSLHTLP